MERELPDNFIFTQHALAAFESCPLKFKRRYVEKLKWNSFPDEKTRRRVELGRDFHLLAHRYFSGVDPFPKGQVQGHTELGMWMDNLKKHFPIAPGRTYLPEYKLRANLGKIKLEANFDLLVLGNDTIEVWDWKTQEIKTGKPQGNSKFKNSLQTMVYLYVLKKQIVRFAGTGGNNMKIAMYYWQPEPPRVAAGVEYSDRMHEDFRRILEQKIACAMEYDYTGFDKSLYVKHCKYCEFNWLCNKRSVGTTPGQEASDDRNSVEQDSDNNDENDWVETWEESLRYM